MAEPLRVFISHVFEERHVALVLQKYVRRAFNNAFPVFAAFDKDSIGGGKKWFDHIIENLGHSAVVLVLVSTGSRRRPWLNFEAGFGAGNGADVIPVSIRDFSLSKLDFPLAGYQGRSIEDLPSILSDITRRVNQPSEAQDLNEYLSELREAEGKMAYKTLEVRPFVHQHVLQFEIENKGNTDIELLMLEVLVPRQYVSPHWSPAASDFRHFKHTRRADEEYFWFACTSQRGAFGGKDPSLRPIITPAMGTVVAYEMKIAIIQQAIPYHEQHRVIYYQVHAADCPTGMETTTWVKLDFRT